MSSVEERLCNVEEMLGQVLRMLKGKKARVKYQAKYYAERRANLKQQTLEKSGIKNPDHNNLDLPMGWDRRLQSKVEEWALVAYRFAEGAASAYKFMEWLAYTWNSCTYWHKVITRSGGYNHVFYGFSGTKPLRMKWTDNDLFGSVNRTSFTRAQRDQFGHALWWNWGYGVLGKVALEMQEDEERWKKLPKHFTRPCLLMTGGFGMVEVRQGLVFDPNEGDCNKMATMYKYAKPDLDRGWTACKRGLFAKEEPSADFVNALTDLVESSNPLSTNCTSSRTRLSRRPRPCNSHRAPACPGHSPPSAAAVATPRSPCRS